MHDEGLQHSYPLPELQLFCFLFCRTQYDGSSIRKKNREKPRMMWVKGVRDGRIIPGYVLSHTVLVCDHGGQPYKPMKHLKGARLAVMQKEVH